MMYTVTVRSQAKVRKERYGDLAEALAALESTGRELADDADGQAAGGRLIRKIEPVQRVVARIELSGPGKLRAGVDVRGDGSNEAFTGRVKRRLVEQRRGESAYQALRRTLTP